MIFERPILRPIITPTNHNKSEQSDKPIRIPSILQVTCPKGNCTIGFTFASYYWLQNWREIFKPIIKRGNHNQVINFRQSFENCSIWHHKTKAKASKRETLSSGLRYLYFRSATVSWNRSISQRHSHGEWEIHVYNIKPKVIKSYENLVRELMISCLL